MYNPSLYLVKPMVVTAKQDSKMAEPDFIPVTEKKRFLCHQDRYDEKIIEQLLLYKLY